MLLQMRMTDKSCYSKTLTNSNHWTGLGAEPHGQG